jgi:hypothetical protein
MTEVLIETAALVRIFSSDSTRAKWRGTRNYLPRWQKNTTGMFVQNSLNAVVRRDKCGMFELWSE